MMIRTRAWRRLAMSAIAALALSACGASGSETSVDTTVANEPEAAAVSTTAPEPEEVEMPDLVGMTEDEARADLADVGVEDGDIEVEEQESMLDPGSVIEQVPSAGSAVSGSVNLIIAVPVPEVPDFIGADISEVRDWADERGITVVETEVLDDEQDEGAVVKTTPAAGADPAVELAVDVVVAPMTQALAGLEPADTANCQVETGDADLSGDVYPDSIQLVTDTYREGICQVDYDLGRDWTSFKVAVGLRDDAPTASRVKITVIADGDELFNETMNIGTARDLDLDVSGVLRLTLFAQRVSESGERPVGVFGNARLTAPPEDADTTSSTNDDDEQEEDASTTTTEP